MASRLADRLNGARQHQFVGRAVERTLFQATLTAPELPFCLLYIFGPGGVGKTMLLHEFGGICRQHETPAVYLDARNVKPTPEAFLGLLSRTLGLQPSYTPLQVLAGQRRRQVILIDTYETLAPLDHWIREVFLPQLSAQALVVLAGREPPSRAWRTDSGWQTLMQTLALGNLSPDESRSYLTQHAIPPDQHRSVLDFTHGHPLALSLVADLFAQRPGVHFQPETAPDVIKTLLEQLVQNVSGPAHRTALEACALVRVMTEALLSAMLCVPDAHELFGWLRGLSLMESGQRGLFPHDLAREALSADLRWRNPDWYAELRRRARNYYTRCVQQSQGAEQQRSLFDYVFLHRDNPALRPFLEWQESGGMLADAARESEWPALIAMVARHEGEASAEWAAHWFRRQPQGVIVFRNAEQQPTGFMATVALQQASPADRQADPATRAAWEYLQHHAPLRPGEAATLFRFWMASDSYQTVSALQSLIFVSAGQYYLHTPGLACTFFPCAAADFWEPGFAYLGLTRTYAADFVVDGKHYGVYSQDWRTLPPLAWLEMLAEHEAGAAPVGARPPAAPIVILSQPRFEAAVRDALHDLARPDLLRRNPLLRSRLVLERSRAHASEAERIATLQALVQEAAEALQASPRELKCYRALYHTYLNPAPNQEQAAELLDLPFSTFRRHLKTGVTRAAELLWRREVHGVGQMSTK